MVCDGGSGLITVAPQAHIISINLSGLTNGLTSSNPGADSLIISECDTPSFLNETGTFVGSIFSDTTLVEHVGDDVS